MIKRLILAAVLAASFAAQAATLTFSITVPDAQQARAMTALRTHYTTINPATGLPVVPTQAQAIEKYRQSVAAALKDLVLKVERDAATAAAATGVTPVDSQ